MLLLDDVRIAPGASPETAFDQEVMQLNEPRHCHARSPDLHSDASHRIQHPRRDHRNHAECCLDIDKAASDALFAAMAPDTMPIKGVPAIMDLDLLPDMGRMTGRLPWGARTGLSLAMAAQDTDQWWRERRVLARELLDLGDVNTAYQIVGDAAAPANKYYRAEFHFMAGWIALRFLNDPTAALTHFAHVE